MWSFILIVSFAVSLILQLASACSSSLRLLMISGNWWGYPTWFLQAQRPCQLLLSLPQVSGTCRMCTTPFLHQCRALHSLFQISGRTFSRNMLEQNRPHQPKAGKRDLFRGEPLMISAGQWVFSAINSCVYWLWLRCSKPHRVGDKLCGCPGLWNGIRFLGRVGRHRPNRDRRLLNLTFCNEYYGLSGGLSKNRMGWNVPIIYDTMDRLLLFRAFMIGRTRLWCINTWPSLGQTNVAGYFRQCHVLWELSCVSALFEIKNSGTFRFKMSISWKSL